MDLSNLKPAAGSTHNSKRVGRGQGSGKGGTSARGHKGAKSRSGYKRKIGFEGGQMPIQRRLPKFGFKNINRVEHAGVNLSKLQYYSEKLNITDFNLANLISNGIVTKNDRVKVLGAGELTVKVNVEVHAISAKAKETIEKLGGTVKLLS